MSAPTAGPAGLVQAGPAGPALEVAACETLGGHRRVVVLVDAGLASTRIDVIDPRCTAVSVPEPRQYVPRRGGSVEGVVPA